jgi:acetylornithine deacetylase/succinyl-diaminopimelate desuccinylase-like protein
MKNSRSESYAAAGVDITAGYKAVELMKAHIARTMTNAVAFGPNFLHRPDICHQPDEHIYLEDFIKWIAIYAKAIYLLAK